MIRFALQSETFRLVSSCTTVKEICDRLKELYSTDEDLEHSIQTLLHSEFGDFKKKPEEKLIQAFDRFNHLLNRMIKNGIERNVIEQKVTFMNGLRTEWMAMVSTVKAHEQFKAYSLAKLVGISKSHESAVSNETNVVSSMGSLALILKGKNAAEEEEDLDLSEYDLTSEDFTLMGSYSVEKVKEKPKNVPQSEEPKKETKFGGDSGFNCHYCGGKSQFAKDCMLRKKSVKNDDDDEEASLLHRLDEIKKKKVGSHNTMNALIVQGNTVDDEFGSVEIWSTDSEEEDVQPTLNQVHTVQGVTQLQTAELTTLVKEDNADGCDEFFRSAPIDNADETEGPSQKTSWRVKGRYVAEPLNDPTRFDVPSTRGTKIDSDEPVKMSSKTSSLKSGSHAQVMRDEQFDDEWYIYNGCLPHITGRKEELMEFQSLQDGGCVKYGNNSFGTIKGYDMITNGDFSIRKVAYVEGLQTQPHQCFSTGGQHWIKGFVQ
ncbi:uncharacterized protein LOC111886644 [Lactuca sativa]|uniref:uncharacterized protein LOC111886644 n=1 Tax=Lactuca sativa TaxID=4236 RepID=UPI000CD9DE3C|nr:uncharacterized protein LOC111886644 [Lactuca sativa]